MTKAKVKAQGSQIKRRDYVIGEFMALHGTDWPERLAVRLGYTNVPSLIESLRDWGRPDLASMLVRAEWDGLADPKHRTVLDRKKGSQW